MAVSPQIQREVRALIHEIGEVSWVLFKVLVPVIIVVKILELLGVVALLNQALSPLMQFIDLPIEYAVVWAVAMLVGLYPGFVLALSVHAVVPLSIAQVSVLGVLLLYSHALVIEGAIAKKAGVPLWLTLLTRLVLGYLAAYVLAAGYATFGALQDPNQIAFFDITPAKPGLVAWALDQLQNLLMIEIVIVVLMVLLKVLKLLGIEAFMVRTFAPLLRALHIAPEAATLAMVGITLGLTYGGGLLINEAKRGVIAPRDIVGAMLLVGLLHSLIEDTVIILVLGADWAAIVVFRALWAFAVVYCVMRFIVPRIPLASVQPTPTASQ